MSLRNKLEEFGKMKGVNQDEKGECIRWCIVHLAIITMNS